VRSVKNYGAMTCSLLETLVKKALSIPTRQCFIGFQGGEPTLAGLDFYKKLIDLEQKYNRNNVEILHTFQTNGLLVDDEWAEFFIANKFLVGLSIDASKDIHDSLRPDVSLKGTHNRCIKAAQKLRRHGVEFNILSVVTHFLASHPDKVYNFYKRNGFKYVQFIPCLDVIDKDRHSSLFSLDAEIYGSFLCRIFDLWYADYIKGDYFSIRMFDNYIHILAGAPPENCAMRGICSAYALVEADGSVYPCDFYALDEFRLGNISTHCLKEMLCGETAEAFLAPSKYSSPKCTSCEYRQICRGGCRRDREPIIDGMLSLNRYCNAYKMFFQHTLQRMIAIAQVLR